MRWLFALIALSGTARADVVASAAAGAGAEGDATYAALELRLDLDWPSARIGLAAHGVWLDGAFRKTDYQRAADVVTLVRYLEVGGPTLALAAGGLAPSYLEHVAAGYRATLDDRYRTGARAALAGDDLTATAEIDDVLDPALVGAAVDWQVTPAWIAEAAAAIDPGTMSAYEAGIARRWERPHELQIDAGGALVVEPSFGASAVGFTTVRIDQGRARWTITADLRAGHGTLGAMFGPLYRLERDQLRAQTGTAGGVEAGIAHPIGWLAAGIRTRPGLGPLATFGGGLPAGRYLQAAAWLAAGTHAAAGAGELRAAWSRSLFSALRVARMYEPDAMLQPRGVWSVTAWFGAGT